MSEDEYQCGRAGRSWYDYEYSYNFYGYGGGMRGYESRDKVCGKSTAALVFDWFTL